MPLLDLLLINFGPLSVKHLPLLKIPLILSKKIQNIHLDENDIMVSFDVVSLFTKP
jgi:hypothetical protein